MRDWVNDKCSERKPSDAGACLASAGIISSTMSRASLMAKPKISEQKVYSEHHKTMAKAQLYCYIRRNEITDSTDPVYQTILPACGP